MDEMISDVVGSLNWPIAVIIIVLFFMVIFRKSIERLVDRIKTVDGFKLHLDEVTQSEEDKKKQLTKNEMNPLVGSFNKSQHLDNTLDSSQIINNLKHYPDSLSVRERIQLINDERKKYNIDGRDLIDILIRQLAATQVVWNFETIYNIIFGSQINLLKILNQQRVTGLPKSYIENYFEQLKKNVEELHQWSVNDYLVYISNEKLIFNKNEYYFITDKGVDFLNWLVLVGRQDKKGN